MPLDQIPLIPLMGQPMPQMPSPLDSLGKMMQVKNAQAEMQQRQAQTADLQAQAQQRQRDLDSTQKLQTIFQDEDNQKAFAAGDFSSIWKGGVSPSIAGPAITQLQTMRDKAQSLTKAQAEFYADGRSKLQEVIQSVDPKDPNAPQMFAQAIQGLGTVHPELAKQIQPPPPDQDFGQYLKGLAVTNGLSHKILVSQTEAQKAEADLTHTAGEETRAAALAPDALRKAAADASIAEQKANNATPITLEQQAQLDATAAQQKRVFDETKAQHGIEYRLAGGRLAVSQAELKLKTGGTLGELNPAQKLLAQKLADGEMNPTSLSRYPDREVLMAGAMAINPAWTQATYDTKQAFTDPQKKQAMNLGTISRIVGHIGRFEKNSQALGIAPGYAYGVSPFGGAKTLGEDAHAVSSELEKLVSGGVGTEGQVRSWQDALHSTLPETRQQAIDEISQLIGSQYEGMQQTYKAGTGRDLPVEKYVNPAGQAWMKAKGINVVGGAAAGAGGGGKITITAPDGSVHPFDTQAQADAFKKLAHIQ